MKEENIQRLLKANNITDFYNIYFELIPNGGIELKTIDSRLVKKEKELISDIPKEQTVEYGVDVFRK